MTSRSHALQRRLIDFGVAVSALSRRVPRDAAGRNASQQLVRAATAPAALYAEARDAESTVDYVHKVKMCIKELREAAVWLEVARRTSPDGTTTEPLERECDELTAIFVTCVKKARAEPRKQSQERGANTRNETPV